MRIVWSKLTTIDIKSVGAKIWCGYKTLNLDLFFWTKSWQIRLDWSSPSFFRFLFPKTTALNLAVAQNDIKPLLPFISKPNYSAATIILNSDSDIKKDLLKHLMKGK